MVVEPTEMVTEQTNGTSKTKLVSWTAPFYQVIALPCLLVFSIAFIMEIQQVLAAKIGLRTRQAASIQGMFILDNINPLALNILAVSMSL